MKEKRFRRMKLNMGESVGAPTERQAHERGERGFTPSIEDKVRGQPCEGVARLLKKTLS